MKPIAQTFYINEPPPPAGSAGVFITAIEVYFKSVSSKFGIELQIRETENGVPTSSRLPFASKILFPTNTNNPVASDDASVATKFEFNTPVFVEAAKSYAFLLIPIGGNPDYNVWTAAIGENDVSTNTPIYTNNDTGDLFLSSNDLSWNPIINEDIKFNLYIANFTSSTGVASFKNPSTDRIQHKNKSGKLIPGERVAIGNSYLKIALLNLSSINGTFNVGDTVYQKLASANVTGTIYASNSTAIKVASVSDRFTTTNTINDSTTSANATVLSVSQNVITTTVSNTITVPDGNYFASNDYIYLVDSGSNAYMYKISSVSDTTLTLDRNIDFSSSDAVYGKIFSNYNYNGRFFGGAGKELSGIVKQASLTLVNSSETYNATQINADSLIIGLDSHSIVSFIDYVDQPYNSVTPNFTYVSQPNTSVNFSFKGFANNNNRDQDSDYITLTPGRPTELIDKERVLMSRSSEWANLPINRKGDRSFDLRVAMSTDNPKISPIVDTIETNLTLTYNIVGNEEELNGYYLTINKLSYGIPTGTIITQNTFSTGNNATGTVYYANSNYIMLTNVNGQFIGNTNFTVGSNTGYVKSAEKFSDSLNNGYYDVSRYISKNIILATGQDSEDMRAYLGAYRPANTNFAVYTKIINNADNDLFNDKDWTRLTEYSPASLQSSTVSVDDQVELVYGFANSQTLFETGTITEFNYKTIHCTSTANISNNDIVYFGYDKDVKRFNANTKVNSSSEFITLVNHQFTNNSVVAYSTAYGNTVVSGLSNNGVYYVRQANSTGIKLSATYNGSPINITASSINEGGHYLTQDVKAFNVREVMYVINSTAFVIDRPASFSTGFGFLGKIPNIETTSSAFLYDRNNNIVRYSTSSDAVYDSYIQFAMKIVPTAVSSSIVPRAGDLRVLALQV